MEPNNSALDEILYIASAASAICLFAIGLRITFQAHRERQFSPKGLVKASVLVGVLSYLTVFLFFGAGVLSSQEVDLNDPEERFSLLFYFLICPGAFAALAVTTLIWSVVATRVARRTK